MKNINIPNNNSFFFFFNFSKIDYLFFVHILIKQNIKCILELFSYITSEMFEIFIVYLKTRMGTEILNNLFDNDKFLFKIVTQIGGTYSANR